mmetsp:Transcript_26630/g.88350  ORF Transcript_26630/g.88350 Transcript_26630/m.88350 type:complete len:260 (-) Transcript_26630:1596-2375(-)
MPLLKTNKQRASVPVSPLVGLYAACKVAAVAKIGDDSLIAIIQSIRLVRERVGDVNLTPLRNVRALPCEDVVQAHHVALVHHGPHVALVHALRHRSLRAPPQAAQVLHEVLVGGGDHPCGDQGTVDLVVRPATDELAADEFGLFLDGLQMPGRGRIHRGDPGEAEDAISDLLAGERGVQDADELPRGAEKELSLQIQQHDAVALSSQGLHFPARPLRAAHDPVPHDHVDHGRQLGALHQEDAHTQHHACEDGIGGRREY